MGDVVGPEIEAVVGATIRRALLDLAPRRDVVAWPDEQPDPCVAERDEVAHRLLHGDRVVARDAREAEAVDAGVDEDRRQTALGEAAVVTVRRVGLGVETAGEDDARDLLLEEEVDVVRLGHAADRLRAQDRGVALLGERARHDLREGREDRVLELRQDEADEARPFAAELGRVARSPGRRGRSGRTGGSTRRRRASR